MPTTTTVNFGFTGAAQLWTVPVNVNRITFTALGAGGGTGSYAGGGGGAAGGLATLSIPVVPGDVCQVNVGAWGGNGSTDGGGATDIRIGGTARANRICVAAGAGGTGVAGGDTGNPSVHSAYGVGGQGGGLTGQGGTAGTGYGGTSGGAATTGATQSANGSPATVTVAGGGGDGYFMGGGINGGTSSAPFYGGSSGGGGGSSYLATTAPAGATTAGSTTSGGGSTYAGSASITYTSNLAPYAPTLTGPGNNTYVDLTAPIPLTWTFGDPDVSDAQSKADVRYKIPAGAWTTISAAATTASTYSIPASTFGANTIIEWQVLTYDTALAPSPWSSSFFFTPETPPSAPTVTAPPSGATVTYLPTTPLVWTAPSGQSDYQARRVGDISSLPDPATLYEDTGVVASTGGSGTFTNTVAHVTGAEHWQVRVRTFGTFWSPWADRNCSVNLSPPMTPMVVCVANPASASVVVAVTNPAPTTGYSATVSNDIARTSPDGSTVRVAKGLPPGATFTDMRAGAGLNTYIATALAANGATSHST